MKRSVLHDYNQWEEKLTGYVAMLNFRFMNLCIKAEEASLLPINVTIEGMSNRLEQVSLIAKKDEYSFMVVPNIDGDLKDVAQGIAMSHPEFKQDVESLRIEALDAEGNPTEHDVPYILLTMPEVNDDRYDFLKQAVDTFYQECKVLMDKATMQARGQIAMNIIGEPEEDVDGMNKAIDKLKEDKEKQRDELRDKKLHEIEEAHNKWLAEQAQQNQQDNGNWGGNAGNSMRFNSEDEN
jgi:ribosome recycling factor